MLRVCAEAGVGQDRGMERARREHAERTFDGLFPRLEQGLAEYLGASDEDLDDDFWG